MNVFWFFSTFNYIAWTQSFCRFYYFFLHFFPFVLSYCKNLQYNMYSTWPYIHNYLSLYFDKAASKILLLTMEFTIDFLLNILYKVKAVSFYFLFTKILFLKS